ncbi:MAG: hypothetical protein PHC62_00085 [Candidatus Izemoplasmatales bacterium]|nr:hypothetical protein [Candidatus Izemoplasmatales bacterium]
MAGYKIKPEDYKVVIVKVYLNDKRLLKFKTIQLKETGLRKTEEMLATSKVFSFSYFKGFFRKKVCFMTFKSDAVKYISMETGRELSFRESSCLREKIYTNTNYLSIREEGDE